MKIDKFKEISDKFKIKNLVLMGHMGSGKSIIGRKIALYFNIQHVDIDFEIIKIEKISINEIFSLKGEDYFRKLEHKITKKFLNKNNIIISLGGGAILNSNTRKLIKENSFSIFLDSKLNILQKRLINSKNRPLLNNKNILTTLKKLDKDRRKYYLKANLKIDNSWHLNKTILNLKKFFTSIND